MGRRIRWLGIVMILVFGLVLAQLVNIQFRKASALAGSPDNPRNAQLHLANNRGAILAADGTVLAKSVKATQGSYTYQRVYPTGSLFSQIVGYDSSLYGTWGVEYQYNNYLVPHRPAEASSLSQFFSNLLNPPPPTTDNVTLTVQPYLQQTAEQALANVVGDNKDGAVVAVDPATGAIEAMYSSPSFDPNPLASPLQAPQELGRLAYESKDHEGFSPQYPIATAERFPPGSTSKVVTSEAAFNLQPSLSNFVAPTVYCLPLPESNKSLCNSSGQPCGGTIAQMLPPSCDPGFAELGLQLGADTLSHQAALFGYNQVPPVDLPGVIPSAYPTAAELANDQLGPPGIAYSSIGQQNVATTALQNALIAAGIANHGIVMTPHVMAQVHDSQGNVVSTYQTRPWVQAVSAPAAAQLVPIMESVAKDGTASGIFPPALDAAVKTGTAQTGLPQSPTDDWMIGFAPAYDPVVAVAVIVPFQAQSDTGAAVAGPIMRTMLTAALAHAVAAPGSKAPAG
jgi:peptidoglycan glycosyltransferase